MFTGMEFKSLRNNRHVTRNYRRKNEVDNGRLAPKLEIISRVHRKNFQWFGPLEHMREERTTRRR